MYKPFAAAAGFAALSVSCAFGQTPCLGTAISGTVRDTTRALIPNATLTVDGLAGATSGSDGRFRIACVAAGSHRVAATADGFAAREVSIAAPRTADVDLALRPADVQTEVEVNGDDGAATDTQAGGPTQTIAGKQLQQLADDPDDLLRELQQLAAAAGGSPGNATIAVDGFQDSVALPPKSSIAYIKVNPDLFSAEYRQPPFEGGRVEIYTKPGQKTFHGALFATNGSPFENARDPFSTGKAALGKQRYGFEFSGPVRPGYRNGEGSDFSLTLEHRSIDNAAVVNAYTLDGGGNTVNTIANVATPQRLWVGLARLGWQLGAKNTFIASYSANVNHLENVGVGGTTLAEGGYDSANFDHILRLSDISTLSPHLMHESRLSLRLVRRSYLPDSTATQVQVAGAFTGGGNTLGTQQAHKFIVEFDDDAIFTPKSHTIKFGTELLVNDEHLSFPTNFNGTYIFSSLATYATGTPTAYTGVSGTPAIAFNQFQDALFLQDDWNVGRGFHVAAGLRYYLQSDPTTFNAITPRLGVLWSPSKKGTWTLHAHAGLFSTNFGDGDPAEIQREDGIHRVTRTVYNPVYGNPFGNATPIYSMRRFSPRIATGSYAIENIGGTRALPHGWNLSADYFFGRLWNMVRTENVNAPLHGDPTGPRALGIANTDILETQNSGQGWAKVIFFGVDQHSYKRLQLFLGGVHVVQIDDNDDKDTFTPQSAFTDAGEFAPRANQAEWNLFGNATLTLPRKVQLSANFNGSGDAHYNVTTGFDNNGDGDFNDRPQFAAPGTPGAIATPYGLLAATGGTGVLRRNIGVMPWTYYLDANLQRAFKLTHNAKADHPQTLTVNVRSSNVLNHRNVMAVGGVLGSPLFGKPYAADNGRRIEAGVRYSF